MRTARAQVASRSDRRGAGARPAPYAHEARRAGAAPRSLHRFGDLRVLPRPLLQRFTAEQGDEGRVFLVPEKGDTDADLNRALCPGITNRKIGGRSKIDITDCLPKGVLRALTLGPYNCAQFVNMALQEKAERGSAANIEQAFTVKLWHELLKSGHRIVNVSVVDKDGKVERVKEITWKQLDPRAGDIVFMAGNIIPKQPKGFKEPDPAGDTFEVTWDHVGFFLVRSRKGQDFHLAKDGDENPIGVYHTGMALSDEEGLAPGAYVRGASTLAVYLRPGEQKQQTPAKAATPTPTKTPVKPPAKSKETTK